MAQLVRLTGVSKGTVERAVLAIASAHARGRQEKRAPEDRDKFVLLGHVSRNDGEPCRQCGGRDVGGEGRDNQNDLELFDPAQATAMLSITNVATPILGPELMELSAALTVSTSEHCEGRFLRKERRMAGPAAWDGGLAAWDRFYPGGS